VIDIQSVILNSLWILGLSVILATWSYARYTAYRSGLKVRSKLDELRYAIALDVGLILFIGGMAGTEDRWWARLLWVLIGAAVLIEMGYRVYNERSREEDNDQDL
jgi:uncharacterized membrane protein